MPQGYYVIEQWKQPAWVVVAVLPFGLSLTEAERELGRRGKPGFYRLVQTQRIVWCERTADGVRLRKSHASGPKSLEEMQAMYDRNGGRYPVEDVRGERRKRRSQKPVVSRRAGTALTPQSTTPASR